MSGAQYETTQLRLEPSSRLTFYSDGVIEAQDKSGELLGFDRARELSTRSAAAIAEAARAFGQQDDITVITLERIVVAEVLDLERRTPAWFPASSWKDERD